MAAFFTKLEGAKSARFAIAGTRSNPGALVDAYLPAGATQAEREAKAAQLGAAADRFVVVNGRATVVRDVYGNPIPGAPQEDQ